MVLSARVALGVLLLASQMAAQALQMKRSEYEDRVRGAWVGQIAGTLMGFQFEHKAAAAARVDKIPERFQNIPVDDDWYYEMVAVRAFEKYGIGMTAEQLGEQWKLNSAGSWGSTRVCVTRVTTSRFIPARARAFCSDCWIM